MRRRSARGRAGLGAGLGARLAAAVCGLALAAAALTGCSTGAPHPVGPRFEVSRDPSLSWRPIAIKVLALPPGQPVTITATVAAGSGWSSRAVYAVPGDGVVDLTTQAPLQAAFHGADGMGLFWTLAPRSGNSADAAAADAPAWGTSTVSVRLDAETAGRTVARTSVDRVGLRDYVAPRAVFHDGIGGDYYDPPATSEGLRPAVIVFDGTDTGATPALPLAAQVAALGYPTLALSTFGPAGEPDPSHTLDASRFTAALAWLRSQPGVDRDRIFTFGTSRGAQLALWAAVAYDDQVYGAIAPAGTTGLICTSPVPSPAVTVDGSWVPCTTGTHVVSPGSVLSLDRIQGPLLLACAGHDEQLDNGCAWMAAGVTARGRHPGDIYLRLSDATHLFYAPPYTPLGLDGSSRKQATEEARVVFWRAVAAALSAPSSVPGH
ncbi:acyl-CoA thioesterase/BAAT N-terminal domain-containing protein [Leifsonia sp. NPDC058292]|uniref:acyl-CoA thioesterase/BAAT N-terminal domain-containing protein n=1 Tax=Leifsonia sp. NPDC058292 TaxID=3346428 RepID=UPI0036DEAFB7